MMPPTSATQARGRCMCDRVRFVALAAFDDPVDRTPEGDAFVGERVAWLRWPPTVAP